MNSITVALAKLIVLVAIAAGAWWLAAEQGWVPGRPNSPRTENFKRAIDEHLALKAGPYSRACAPLRLRRVRGEMGPPGVRFDWTPASFLALIDARREPNPRTANQIALLAAQGYFDAKPLDSGTIEYAMTWKGFAASARPSCFEFSDGRHDSEVLTFQRKDAVRGVEVFEVIARPRLGGIAAWARSPEFGEAWGEGFMRRLLEPEPVAFELARIETGFEVLTERGRPARQRGGIDPLLAARLAGTLSAERLRAAIEAWLAGAGAQRARVCLDLPRAGEADETNLQSALRGRGAPDEPIHYTFYNLLERQGRAAERVLAAYQSLRVLESLGHAKSELIQAESFKGRAAAGGVRFTLEPEFAGGLVAGGRGCLPVGTMELAELLAFDPISATNPTPQFHARLALKPYDARAEALIQAYPHLARLQAVGGAMRGLVNHAEHGLQLRSAQLMLPQYEPELDGVALPSVEGGTPERIAPPAEKQ